MNVTFIKLKFHMIVSVIYTALQDLVAEMCNDYFQRFRRQTYVTPKSYLSFIAGYKTIYSEKKGEIGILAERMNTGKYIGVKCIFVSSAQHCGHISRIYQASVHLGGDVTLPQVL